jgi:hypothetical protein
VSEANLANLPTNDATGGTADCGRPDDGSRLVAVADLQASRDSSCWDLTLSRSGESLVTLCASHFEVLDPHERELPSTKLTECQLPVSDPR